MGRSIVRAFYITMSILFALLAAFCSFLVIVLAVEGKAIGAILMGGIAGYCAFMVREALAW